MNWSQFKDPVFHMLLVDDVVTFWSLTLEVVGSNRSGKYFVSEFAEFGKTFRENSNETGLRKTRDY